MAAGVWGTAWVARQRSGSLRSFCDGASDVGRGSRQGRALVQVGVGFWFLGGFKGIGLGVPVCKAWLLGLPALWEGGGPGSA